MIQAIHPVLMVRDIHLSLEFYSRLGFTTAFLAENNEPRYAGTKRDLVELHLQWQDEEQWRYPIDRPTYRFLVSDVDALFAEFQRKELDLQATHIWNTDWGTREFHLRDLDGNGLQFYHPIR